MSGVSVIGEGIRKSGKKYKLIRCNHCGREKEMAANYVDIAKSCGCLNGTHSRGKPSGRRISKGEAAFNRLWNSYRNSSHRRGYVLNIPKDVFRELTSKNCYYCGTPPIREFSTWNGYGKYPYNGLDRVNNTLGYEVDNVVPCCFVCNRAKSTMPQEDFIEWIRRLVAFRKEEQ